MLCNLAGQCVQLKDYVTGRTYYERALAVQKDRVWSGPCEIFIYLRMRNGL
jgi:hypothetical protein